MELLNLNVEKSNMNCTLCKMTLIQIRQMLLNGKSQKQILDYFNNNLCARVGKSKDICTNFVDNYGPVLLELIGKDIVSNFKPLLMSTSCKPRSLFSFGQNPDQICMMLGFCASTPKFEFSDNLQVPTVKGDTTCVICEFTMNLLVKYVNQNSSVVS